ncbi:ABC-three component system middle component 7 [Lactimicrobium massiliense]|uniref:ABC-three component system middle component 7 n=1 Tax=Lactimicrobium massiliense TaxID=2161814 RepID=UPI000D553EEC
MLLPSKLFSYQESTLSKLPVILKQLKKRPMGVKELYGAVKKDIRDTDEFLEILDCLFVLDAIDYDDVRRQLIYVIQN